MIKYNKERLPKMLVQGQVWHPSTSLSGTMDDSGRVEFLMSVGGITLNFTIGDLASGMRSDHLEPGVSSKNPDEKKNNAYLLYSCIGNKAVVASGDAKGAVGFVTGKHGGCNHVLIYFDNATLEKLSIDDKINVYAQGQGLELCDYPGIIARSLGPELIEKLNITEDGGLKIGVAKIMPACLMGSGLGSPSAHGDYDVTLFDKELVKKYGLDGLRVGDIVAIEDADTRYGRIYMKNAVTIGVVSHGDCIIPGHGPGITTILSGLDGEIKPFIDERANLAQIFGVRD